MSQRSLPPTPPFLSLVTFNLSQFGVISHAKNRLTNPSIWRMFASMLIETLQVLVVNGVVVAGGHAVGSCRV
jgi:hypothetical protein